MILTRLGNKRAKAAKYHKLFPKHDTYFEPFFGAGGMFWTKPQAKYNYLNDLDSDVFNLWQVVKTRKDELFAEVEMMPIHRDLLEYWKKNKETDPIMKAARFLFLSNFTFLGKADTLHFAKNLPKEHILRRIDKTFELLKNTYLTNVDFEKFFKNWVYGDKEKAFAYIDPPYLDTVSTYETTWTEADTERLFRVAVESGVKFGLSEFAHPSVLELAKYYGLHVHVIGERQNLKNRQTEIYIVNYDLPKTLF